MTNKVISGSTTSVQFLAVLPCEFIVSRGVSRPFAELPAAAVENENRVVFPDTNCDCDDGCGVVVDVLVAEGELKENEDFAGGVAAGVPPLVPIVALVALLSSGSVSVTSAEGVLGVLTAAPVAAVLLTTARERGVYVIVRDLGRGDTAASATCCCCFSVVPSAPAVFPVPLSQLSPSRSFIKLFPLAGSDL
jgi:hypothetical protein